MLIDGTAMEDLLMLNLHVCFVPVLLILHNIIAAGRIYWIMDTLQKACVSLPQTTILRQHFCDLGLYYNFCKYGAKISLGG